MNKKTLKEYRIWRAMKARCYSPSQTKGYYKEDNIKVCDRWLHSFENFLADMGYMPDNSYSIERKNIYKDYSPDNCIWIPQRDQSKNRRNSKVYTIDGQEMCLKDIARYLNISYRSLYMRIYRGETLKEAIKHLTNLK